MISINNETNNSRMSNSNTINMDGTDNRIHCKMCGHNFKDDEAESIEILQTDCWIIACPMCMSNVFEDGDCFIFPPDHPSKPVGEWN